MTYENYDVLQAFTPDAGQAAKHSTASSLAIVASTVGTRRVFDRKGFPVLTRSITLIAINLDQVIALRSFIKARKGRVVPFWLPTGKHELVLALPALAGAVALTVKSTGYAAMFAASNARRHLVLGSQFVKATSVVSNGNGTDTVYLASQVQAPLQAGAGLSCLMLCRLAADDVSLSFDHPTVATASFDVVELPKETP